MKRLLQSLELWQVVELGPYIVPVVIGTPRIGIEERPATIGSTKSVKEGPGQDSKASGFIGQSSA